MVIGKFELLLDSDEDKAAVLKPDEFKRLLREASYGRNGLRNLVIIWMSFGAALRVTEISKLKVKDIVNIDGTIKDEFRLPAAYTKNNESRLAYIVEDEHIKAVRSYLALRLEKKLRVSDNNDYCGLQPDSPLLLGRGSSGFAFRKKVYEKTDGTIAEYWVCSSLQQLISSLVKKIGVPGGSSHSGRRTFATRLAERGVDLEYIKYLLGHKSKQQTLAYIDSNPRIMRNILKNIYKGI